ncbi:hypothetical protein EBZ37_08595, partial [bacterium]|nr:hypothetical protein [bacterium]
MVQANSPLLMAAAIPFYALDLDVLLLSQPAPEPFRFRSGLARADEAGWTIDSDKGAVLCCRLWGRTADGASACVVVYDAWCTRWLLLDSKLSRKEAERLAFDVESALRRRQPDLGELAAQVSLQEAPRSSGFHAQSRLWLRVAAASPGLARWACSPKFQQGLGPRRYFAGAQAFTRLTPDTELLARTGIQLCSWCGVMGEFTKPQRDWAVEKMAHVSIENLTRLASLSELPPLPRLQVLSFDLECVSATREFPDPKKRLDRICTVGVVLSNLSEADSVKDVA